jgi:hypothetical protein
VKKTFKNDKERLDYSVAIYGALRALFDAKARLRTKYLVRKGRYQERHHPEEE